MERKEVMDSKTNALKAQIKPEAPLTQVLETPGGLIEALPVQEDSVSDKARVLSQTEIFQTLPPAMLEFLSQTSGVRTLDDGDFLVIEGDEPPCGFIVLSGRISITKTSASGKELIVSLLGPGDIFGLFYLLSSFSDSSSARAQTNSRVLWIPKASFQAVTQKHPEIFEMLSKKALERLVSTYELASSLAHARVEDRIIAMLLALLPHFGRRVQKSANSVRLYMTRKELADLTGTTPETAIRATKKLEREGYLDLSRPGIVKIADIDGLRQHLASADGSNVVNG